MKHEKQLQTLLSDALSKDLLFATFRYPGKDEVTFVCQTNRIIRDLDSIDKTVEIGFILQDFLSENGIWIQADIVSSNFEQVPTLPEAIPYNKSFPANISNPISKSDYLKEVSNLVENIKTGDAQKVVYSRTMQVGLKNTAIIPAYFNLLKKHQDAFVFLVHLPGGITWIGASPETLLCGNDIMFETMALAGTRKTNDSNWSQKERDEQSYVTDFIEKSLKTMDLTYQKSDLFEKKLDSGIMHLCNEFSFSIQEKHHTWKLVDQLHPTPAVCGIPTEKAKQLILKSEKHPRSYYSGYLGSVNLEGETNLFVNLRSAQVFEDQACLYLGGGITSDSSPEAEWDETEMKSRTLLDALEGQDKMQIFSE